MVRTMSKNKNEKDNLQKMPTRLFGLRSAGTGYTSDAEPLKGHRMNEKKGEKSTEDKLREAELRRTQIHDRIRSIPSRAKKLLREYRADASLHVREGIIGFALALCAYLLGACKLPFDSYPLGMGLLCASPKKVLWIFFGLCASAFTLPEGAFVYIFAYATAVSVRILARLLIDPPEENRTVKAKEKSYGIKGRADRLFGESIYLRMATACATAFIVGLYMLASRGFVYYDLFSAVFSMLCAPTAVFLYSGCFEENGTDERFREPAAATLAISLTYALRNMSFIGISIGMFFGFFITVYTCRQLGIVKGMILGLLCGVAYSPAYAPMFALAGAVASLIWSISSAWAMTAACALAVIWGFYVEGTGAVSHVLPAVMTSAVCYVGAQKLSFFPAAKDLLFSGKYCADMNDADMWRIDRRRTEWRLGELSDSFEALSEIFENLSGRLSRPGIPELRRMCDGVYDKYCPFCTNRQLCWEIEYSQSASLIGSIGDMLAERGVASVGDLPEYMQSRCTALPGIIGEINRQCAALSRLSGISDKTEVFAMDYRAVAELLADASAKSKENLEPDRELTDKLTRVLSRYGFGDGGVSVYGKREKHIIARGFDMSGAGGGMEELKREVSAACGFTVSDPIIELGEGSMTLRMTRARSICARCTMRVCNTGDEECGDTAISFETAEDRHCVLISDGMGRGREAALTSGICSMFIRKMLSGGGRAETAIKMLSNFIKTKSGECSTTLDLIEIDLLSGKCEFYKCGAAASFVKRGDNIFKLGANTVPLGLISVGDIGKLTFEAKEGDVIFMLSDGVIPDGDESVWFLDLLSSGYDSDPDRMSEKLISEARRRGSDDDISVVIIKLARC